MPPRTPKNLYNPVKPSNLGEREAGLRPPSAPPHPCGPAPRWPRPPPPRPLPSPTIPAEPRSGHCSGRCSEPAPLPALP